MKKISVLIPCYNEKDNVVPISEAVLEQLKKNPQYDYELVFIDNCSTDGTREKLRQICAKNRKIKAILNARNFGPDHSSYYGIMQMTGDCVIAMDCDFQAPPELLPTFIKEWEDGAKIVAGIKEKSKENFFMKFLRSCYYKMIHKFSEVEQIDNFTGFGLYDKSFLDILRKIREPMPFIRCLVAELGYARVDVPYTRQKRKTGKTHYNFYSYFDTAMVSFTSYTKVGLRIATFAGMIISFICLAIALIYLVLKLIHWNNYSAGIIPLILLTSFLGGTQLFFIGFLGEYIMSINQRVMDRPLVVEQERLNF